VRGEAGLGVDAYRRVPPGGGSEDIKAVGGGSDVVEVHNVRHCVQGCGLEGAHGADGAAGGGGTSLAHIIRNDMI
jgi:hypothetical protein